MSKPILILILTVAISLVAIAAHADPEGPGYGQDPGAEPPRTGVGNANSGNHEMHLQNHRKRWSYGVGTSEDETLAAPGSRPVVPTLLVMDFDLVLSMGRVLVPVILR